MRAEDGWVELEVSDRGRGIAKAQGDDANMPKGMRLGVGILGMRERMAQFGGTLEVGSNESGTAVKARIPLTRG